MQWLPWILLIAVVALFIWVGALSSQVADLQAAMAGRKLSRQELEAQYTKGLISRDDYERLKERAK
jgi:uncharacterized membrane protein